MVFFSVIGVYWPRCVGRLVGRFVLNSCLTKSLFEVFRSCSPFRDEGSRGRVSGLV